ncbi:MAG: sigma-54-dependent Fis family transcriptional regulator [Deltaproteobacteria bacterium]|nr:sigma-54-dependent Fis family transcriptional regulator [Deltaproteobacteria bacterium]
MKSKEPLARSTLGLALPPPVLLGLPHEPDTEWTVMIWDECRSRLQLIRCALARCGIHTRVIEDFSALDQGQWPTRGTTVVIALGACPSPGTRELEIIRDLRHKEFTVISYGEGALSWPIGARCRALLAGASWILDSAQDDFADQLRDIIEQHAQAHTARRAEERGLKETMTKLGIIGESAEMLALFRQVLAVSALSDLPTLITGETGTGKELLARALHQLDRKRCSGPFVAVNCGAISAGLAESELFGHRRGAFTGAERDRRGLIRAAHGGVLFLDEIGELDDALQVKLLRVLQERQVLGVGEDSEVAVSVRIIAATNRDLGKMVQQQLFRADLFHRLHVLSIHIPPLRERPADLHPLIEHLLHKNQDLKPTNSLTMSPFFVQALRQLELPGNARQLENLLRTVLVNKKDNTPLDLQDLPPEVWRQLAEQSEYPVDSSQQSSDQKADLCSTPERPFHTLASQLEKLLTANGWTLSEVLGYCERILLEGALRLNDGNQSRTARLLGLTPRSVYSKMRKHHLNS